MYNTSKIYITFTKKLHHIYKTKFIKFHTQNYLTLTVNYFFHCFKSQQLATFTFNFPMSQCNILCNQRQGPLYGQKRRPFIRNIRIIRINKLLRPKKCYIFKNIYLFLCLKVIFDTLGSFWLKNSSDFGKVQFCPELSNFSRFYPVLATGEDFSTIVRLLYKP